MVTSPHDKPKEVKDIQLQQLGPADSLKYFEAFDANRSHLIEHDPVFADIHTVHQVKEMLASYGAQHFGIIHDDNFIGSAALIRAGSLSAPEITYWVDRHHLRQGIATFACRLLVQRAFDSGHNEVYARISPSNEASIKTIKRVGFRRNAILESGIVYSLSKPK